MIPASQCLPLVFGTLSPKGSEMRRHSRSSRQPLHNTAWLTQTSHQSLGHRAATHCCTGPVSLQDRRWADDGASYQQEIQERFNIAIIGHNLEIWHMSHKNLATLFLVQSRKCHQSFSRQKLLSSTLNYIFSTLNIATSWHFWEIFEKYGGHFEKAPRQLTKCHFLKKLTFETHF